MRPNLSPAPDLVPTDHDAAPHWRKGRGSGIGKSSAAREKGGSDVEEHLSGAGEIITGFSGGKASKVVHVSNCSWDHHGPCLGSRETFAPALPAGAQLHPVKKAAIAKANLSCKGQRRFQSTVASKRGRSMYYDAYGGSTSEADWVSGCRCGCHRCLDPQQEPAADHLVPALLPSEARAVVLGTQGTPQREWSKLGLDPQGFLQQHGT